jgi:hypothetical protein
MSMQPITFTCGAMLPLAPEEIARQILDVGNWPKFHGCWPIPGIKAAEFEVRMPDVVGSRIHVTNTDGSSHVEKIIEWQPDRRLRIQMSEFSPPLSHLATYFEETWEFQRIGGETNVIRTFELHSKSTPARLLLRVIAIFLKKAIVRQLWEMRDTKRMQ